MKINPKWQIGSSMLEVMVTIIIVGVGLLGVAAMQANSVKYLRIANQRSEAVQLAYDLGDRMRSNGAALSKYVLTDSSNPSATSCKSTSCTAEQLANRDLYEWTNDLKNRLNGGRAILSTTLVNTQTVYDLTVIWKEAGLTGKDSTCPSGLTTADGERCFGLRIVP